MPADLADDGVPTPANSVANGRLSLVHNRADDIVPHTRNSVANGRLSL
ncbi:hypothetical protein ACQP2P_12230 [Dactylosporangium sp. CA-139114]